MDSEFGEGLELSATSFTIVSTLGIGNLSVLGTGTLPCCVLQ